MVFVAVVTNVWMFIHVDNIVVMGSGISSSTLPETAGKNGTEEDQNEIVDSLSLHDLSYEESFGMVPDIVAYLVDPRRDWKSMKTHKALFFLRHYSGPTKKVSCKLCTIYFSCF